MIGGALQFFFCAMIYFSTAFVARGELSLGKVYALDFTNIDGNRISTSDGRMTVVVLTTTADLAKTQAVSDHVPDVCLGNPTYRMITVINFHKDARRHIFVVTDFSGDVVSQLGRQLQSSGFCVFVFGRSGELLRQWNDVPSAPELAAVLK
jgi:hypothetical protein